MKTLIKEIDFILGHEDVIKLLLDYDADVNITTVDGENGLHLAAFGGF